MRYILEFWLCHMSGHVVIVDEVTKYPILRGIGNIEKGERCISIYIDEIGIYTFWRKFRIFLTECIQK